MSTLTFCVESDSAKDAGLLNYLRDFESIERKYEPRDEKSLTPQAYAIASEAESAHQFGRLTKYEYGDIAANLRLVYGDSEMIKCDIDAYFLVEKKIIHQYLGIPQLEKLYDEDYFNFEWDMHVGQNFNEHKSDYYRDHFIHEIRDMYMMLRLLDDDGTGFYKATKDLLRAPETSKISEYVSKKCRQFVSGGSPERGKVLEDVWNAMQDGPTLENYKEEFFLNYVIYASSMIAGLFHDMGYPICHFLNVRDRTSEYNPFMYMFTHNAFESFDMLAARLSASLLFTIVSPKELRRSMQPDKGRYNHGTYSAIALLLRFYDNGLIYSLSLEQQCAIELAAVAIYNHTAGFDAIKKKRENSYYTMVFRQNPISFLLRFCDDLQEWDRRYFEVSTASDFIFCPQCGVPLLRVEGANNVSEYKCLCKESHTRPDFFVKRKLFLVSVADTVSISLDKEKKELTAKIDYDLYKLLLMSYINETYAQYRAKELYELKKLIDQNYSLQELPFQTIRLDYFVSPNPLWIKLSIVKANAKKRNVSIWGTFRCAGRKIKLKETLCDKLSGFYSDLLVICIRPALKETVLKKYFWSDDLSYNTVLDCLVDDCVKQHAKQAKKNSDEKYYDAYTDKADEARLYHAIRYYTSLDSPCNQYDTLINSQYISFFADLKVFFELWNEAKDLDKQ